MSFFDGDPHFQRLARAFAWLAAEPGIGVVTGEPGVGKSSAMRQLCRALPASERRVVYLSDCAVKPLDLYRMLAAELGLRPGPRAQIVNDIKQALVSLVDERGIAPVIVLDDAQGLRDELLRELHGLTSLDFDGRDYLTVWLYVGPRSRSPASGAAATAARRQYPRLHCLSRTRMSSSILAPDGIFSTFMSRSRPVTIRRLMCSLNGSSRPRPGHGLPRFAVRNHRGLLDQLTVTHGLVGSQSRLCGARAGQLIGAPVE